jgi:glycosyltransferase involved in cell wall biosynthesis
VVVLQHQPGLVPWAQLPALLLHPALHGRVVCVTLHNTQDLAETPGPVRAAAVSALACASRVVVHTLRDMDTMVRLGLGEVATLMPHGTDAPLPGPAPRSLTPDDAVLVGCYGFFLPDKGIPELIAAMGLLRRTWPRARLRLVNAEYPLPQSAAEIAAGRAAVAAAGLGEATEFHTDFLERGASLTLLRECDVVVLPYQRSKEGSSAALRAALGAGVAVAVTPLPLFDEAEDAAIRLPGGTPEAIAAGLDRLLRDVDARTAAVDAARIWSALRDWTAVGRRWHGLLTALSASDVVLAPPS